ncbi:hypothetical protein [Salipiger abyssi]|uniref:hypothetical protein n=1 Tax=Salipiger abyssi TaxID=1250539 RepID=UPI001A8ECD03|nr:hypothetical protein [Salipiger abyssi]MBN9889288.1 hypothetical protein [Salipiger abyssi]
MSEKRPVSISNQKEKIGIKVLGDSLGVPYWAENVPQYMVGADPLSLIISARHQEIIESVAVLARQACPPVVAFVLQGVKFFRFA